MPPFSRLCRLGFCCLTLGLTVAITQAQTNVIVSELGSGSSSADTSTWLISTLDGDASASLVSLTDLGGDLETNASGNSALRLTTGSSNSDRIRVGVFTDLGDAASVLSSIELSFNYYKATVDGGNIYAAPSLRLIVSSSSGTGDNYGELVYEPYWNQPGGGAPAAPADAWQSVTINSSSGSGADASGGWWWTGGFEIANGAGGPPLRSLSEWVTAFQSADATDFATAQIAGFSFGVGTYNLDQLGYVDGLDISISDGLNASYQFSASAVPEPSTYATLLGGAVLLWTGLRRRAARRATPGA